MAKDTNEEVLATERKISLLGIALDLLMRTNGWTVTGLAKAAGVSPKTISSYLWEEALTRERFDELARLMGLSRVKVERAHRAAALVVPPPPAAWSPVEPTPEERRIHEEAAVLAGCEV
ncbi:MAG TPA: helix-turn-helix transcriptional regulator, partial [Thermoanaerobaculia bacterium]|nr:helix-turn-helix transcriptional regulator [Thermoanaerobaculia bacterium]